MIGKNAGYAMAIKTFNNQESQCILTFSQRYGMLMYLDKRDLISQIERDWIQKGLSENSLVFSSELQMKMANELTQRGVNPIRSVEGSFVKILNSSVSYGKNQEPTEQVKLFLFDEGVNYVIAIDKTQDIAAQLAIAVAENMEIGFIYDLSLYAKIDQAGYKSARVIVRDTFGSTLKSNNKGLFDRYTETMKKAKSAGLTFAQQQDLKIGSKAANQVVGQTMDRYRAKFVTQVIDQLNAGNF